MCKGNILDEDDVSRRLECLKLAIQAEAVSPVEEAGKYYLFICNRPDGGAAPVGPGGINR